MAIDLPPPLPPQSVPAAELRSAAFGGVLHFHAYRLHLPADRALDTAALQRAIAGADTLEAAVQALAQAYYADGALSARLLYATSGKDIYLVLQRAPLRAVQAPAGLAPYFEPLVGAPLHDRDFERRRALANVYADREGLAAQARLAPVDDGVRLDIEPEREAGSTNSLQADFGNPGNRFVGRHFLDLDLRHGDRHGDQFKLVAHTALTGIGEANADEYYEETLAWSRATTAGVWELSGHAFDYNGGSGRDGRLREARLGWLMPLAATLQSRVLLELRADYLNREIERETAELREEYPSVQAGVHYSYSASPGLGPLDFDIGSTFRRGLRDGLAPTGAALDYFLWRPTATANLALGDTWNAGLIFAGQLATDTLPLESQWVLGGIDNIAAYLPGVAVGDSGGYLSLDLQYRGWSFAGLHLVPRAFAEYGLSRYDDTSLAAQAHTARLADLGAELTARWRFLEASLAAAAPLLHRHVAPELRHDSEANLLFKISARL